MSVIFPSQVAYDQVIPVKIVVSFAGNFTPSVLVYYWILSNSTSVGRGWRIIEANPVALVAAQNVAIYAATIPSVTFGDVLGYGMNIVFFVSAALGSVTNSTAQGSDAWNPTVLQGKFLVQITDPYPPTIQSISQTPPQPTSADNVTVEATFPMTGRNAPVTQAQLMYTVNGTEPSTTLNMTRPAALNMTQPTASVFEATIPAQGTSSQVSYSVTGTDMAGYSVQSGWYNYQVSPSEAEIRQAQAAQTAQAQRLELAAVVVVVAIVVIVAAVLYRRKGETRSRVKALAARLQLNLNLYTASVILSIAIVAWAGYSVLQFGHAWLALISLLVVVEVLGLADPELGTAFGLGSPRNGLSKALIEAFHAPGAPLLVSAFTLVFAGVIATWLIALGGYIDHYGLISLMHFFASYGFILVGLGAAMRCLSLVFSRGKKYGLGREH
jgi:hypothetical protein